MSSMRYAEETTKEYLQALEHWDDHLADSRKRRTCYYLGEECNLRVPPLHKLTFDGHNVVEVNGEEECGDNQIQADNNDEDDKESVDNTRTKQHNE